jgi:hypothetical protein
VALADTRKKTVNSVALVRRKMKRLIFIESLSQSCFVFWKMEKD